MLCIHPAEIKTLYIYNGSVIGYTKNWGQQDIPRVFRSLKKNEFLPEIGKPLLPSSLRNLGLVFAVTTYCAKNLSKADTISDEALWHNPDNHASPSKRYTIVNMRKRGEPYNQANIFKLFNEN